MTTKTNRKGYVHIYTGNGKGKTTAALGLAMRALGHGMRVYIGQFMKGARCGEHLALGRFGSLVTVEQFGGPRCIPLREKPNPKDIRKAEKGLQTAKKQLVNGKYDLVILDEIICALHFRLVRLEEALELVASKPRQTELVLTGRYAPEELVLVADLVSEIHETKHYYGNGTRARKGIEK